MYKHWVFILTTINTITIFSFSRYNCDVRHRNFTKLQGVYVYMRQQCQFKFIFSSSVDQNGPTGWQPHSSGMILHLPLNKHLIRWLDEVLVESWGSNKIFFYFFLFKKVCMERLYITVTNLVRAYHLLHVYQYHIV